MNPVRFEGNDITPSKVVCVGRNYLKHIQELDNEIPEEPVIFIKPNSAISNEIFAGRNQEIHYEGEITFLIESGKASGIGFGFDLTKRRVQNRLKQKGLPWERAKAFDGSAVFSDFIRWSGNEQDLEMQLFKNGRRVQHAAARLMMTSPQKLIENVKLFLTLEDGDLLMTGTPEGVGPVCKDDTFDGELLCKGKQLLKASWTVK